MKKLAAGLLTTAAMTMAIAPFVVAPAANADVCAGHTDGTSQWAAAPTSSVTWRPASRSRLPTTPYIPGEIPCYTVEGVPYYTPPGDPC